MKKTEFEELCKKAWEPDYGYLVIDRSRKYANGNKYRCSLDLVS